MNKEIIELRQKAKDDELTIKMLIGICEMHQKTISKLMESKSNIRLLKILDEYIDIRSIYMIGRINAIEDYFAFKIDYQNRMYQYITNKDEIELKKTRDKLVKAINIEIIEI